MNEQEFFALARNICLTEAEKTKSALRLRSCMSAHPVREPSEECHTERMASSEREFFQGLRDVTVPKNEADSVRRELLSYMRQHPVSQKRTYVLSPVLAIRSLFFSLRPMVFLLLAAFLTVGLGGVSYAAESSLPGDFLYPMKVNVNEKIKLSLAVSAEAKADIETGFAERRMEEAEKLQALGRLNPQTRLHLSAIFEKHIDRAEKRLAALNEEGKSAKAEKAEVRLQNSLEVHEIILTSLDEESATGSELREMIRSIQNIRSRNSNGNADVRSFSGTAIRINREDVLDKAIDALEKVEKKLKDKREDGQSNFNTVKGKLDAAKEKIREQRNTFDEKRKEKEDEVEKENRNNVSSGSYMSASTSVGLSISGSGTVRIRSNATINVKQEISIGVDNDED